MRSSREKTAPGALIAVGMADGTNGASNVGIAETCAVGTPLSGVTVVQLERVSIPPMNRALIMNRGQWFCVGWTGGLFIELHSD